MMVRMGDAARLPTLATALDLRDCEDGEVCCEVVAGEVVEKAAPSFEHGAAQFAFGEVLGPFRRGGGGGPGGWWIASEVEIELEPHEVYLPDVAGWRRERVPERPTGRPVRIHPDWVCEILSPSTARRDLTVKLLTYARCGVGHYWVVDQDLGVLVVYRLTDGRYGRVLTATAAQTVRAEPFDAIEIDVGLILGRD